MNRTAPRLLALLLCATALAGCGTTDIAELTGGKTAAEAAKAQVADAGKPTSDLDSNVRQAQLLRIAGQYDQAVKILSQLMLVASDDARVLNEYGKTLAEEGRASEAVQFLSRATEIQANDWTTYSAMGVAYDQMGDQASARNAYEHALTLKPQEVSVLNNYALSRMLANDPEGARQLIARAASQGGASDPKIARNIALLNELAPSPVSVAAAPEPKPAALASTKPTPEPQQQATAAPVLPVSSAPPTSAPRPLQQPQPQTATATPHPVTSTSTVVMQRVPVDPLAGPVKVAKTAAKPHAPVTVAGAPHAATADATKPDAKGVAIATLPATPAKPAAAKSVSIPLKAEDVKPAPAKTADNKTDAKSVAAKFVAAKAEAAKPVPVKAADAKPLPLKTAAATPATPAAKPDAKLDVKTAKDAVPALRMTADARQP